MSIKITENKKIALILVDIQNDFLEGGSLAVADANSILKPVNELIRQVKAKNGLIIATKDWHPQDHISFASNHKDKKAFETIEYKHEGMQITQVLWPDHCVQGSRGSDISSEIDLKDIDVIVQKGTDKYSDSYSGFADNNYTQFTALSKTLHQHFIDTLIIVGVATDYCVKFTCLDAIKFGFTTCLVADCTKAVVHEAYGPTLEELKSKGVLIESCSKNLFY